MDWAIGLAALWLLAFLAFLACLPAFLLALALAVVLALALTLVPVLAAAGVLVSARGRSTRAAGAIDARI